jgi:hypothetical protein
VSSEAKRSSLFRIAKYALLLLLPLVAVRSSASEPRVDAISPTSGPEGTRVTISGTNLSSVTKVSFGKIEATFKLFSPGKVVAIVPRWAKDSSVYVNTQQGTAVSPFEFVVQGDPRIPNDVGWKSGYVNPVRPRPDFQAVLLWGIAIADTRAADYPVAGVEVASLQLSCRANGKDFVLTNDTGNLRGGLYRRDPWFGTDEHSPMPIEKNLSQHTASMRVGTRPDRVWHFWSASPRPALPPGKLEGCTAKARVKISNGALVQIGMDYWRSTTALWAGPDANNHEAGVSDWHFASDQWQEITFTDIGGPQV